jgi:predicted MarR family transcription regulator
MSDPLTPAEGMRGTVGPVVSAAHLASGAMPALSEVEFAMTMMVNAYHRWMVRCMAAAGAPGMSPLDTLVLHSVNHRGRPKSLADICLVLNIEDTHTVTYALKKLQKAGLVETGRRGKEKTVAITAAGRGDLHGIPPPARGAAGRAGQGSRNG